jgi:hypothetical protein
MPFQLALPPELEQRLQVEATRRGLPAAAVALQVLDQHLPPADRRTAALALLERWARENEQLTDQKLAENASVLRSIDESRPSYRKLFTDVLKDESK